MKQKITALVLLTAILLTGCGALDTARQLVSGEPAYVSTPAQVDTDLCYYYTQLPELEQSIYACLQSETAKGSDTCVLAHTDYDDCSCSMAYTVEAFLRDNPELYYYSGAATSQGTYGIGENNDVTRITLERSTVFDGTQEEQAAFEQALSDLTAQAAAYETQYEQALFVHDYIVCHTEYDQAAAANISLDEDVDSRAYTAYGCLVEGKAVCSGYAKAFQAVMLRLGIPCAYAVGNADGVVHAWDTVCLDGEWCHVDATWDDPSFGQGSTWPDAPMYTYFGLSDYLLPHLPANMFTMPGCYSDQNDYFVRNGLFVETYSFEAVKQAIEKQSGPIYSVRFGSEEAMEAAISDMVESGRWNSISVLRGQTLKYSRDTDTYTLAITK